jgi:hypothetical protein
MFKSMAIGFVANAGHRLPEQRRVVQYVPQYGDTLCVHISWVRFSVRAKISLLCTASRPPPDLTITHISGNCGSFSCDKTVGGDDLRPCSAAMEIAGRCACWRAACVSTMATNKE